MRGRLERGPHDPFAAAAGEDGRLNGDFVRRACVEPAADRGVFAFGVFAIDSMSMLPGGFVAQRRLDAVEQVSGAKIDVLVELAPHGQQQALHA